MPYRITLFLYITLLRSGVIGSTLFEMLRQDLERRPGISLKNKVGSNRRQDRHLCFYPVLG